MGPHLRHAWLVGAKDPVVDDCISGGAVFSVYTSVVYLLHLQGASYPSTLAVPGEPKASAALVISGDSVIFIIRHNSEPAHRSPCHEFGLSRNISTPVLKHKACAWYPFLNPKKVPRDSTCRSNR
jgi:hypothetical protein